MKVAVRRYRSHTTYRRIVLLHATKDGGPVLRYQASWRTVNGLAVYKRHRITTIVFRRHLPW